MTSQISEISPVLVEIKIQVPWEDVQKGLEDGYTRAQRTAQLKGFRAGKVPRQLIKQYYGPQIQQDVMQSLIERNVIMAVQEHSLPVIATPTVDPEPIKEGQPLAFTAKVEIRPKLDNITLDGIEIMQAVTPVTDEAITKELDRMREENATHQAPEPARPAKSGDMLTIDYEVAIDGEAKPELKAAERQVELGAGRLLPEFDEVLIGANAGETKVVTVKFADDHQAEDLRGKTAKFDVTIRSLQEKILPALDNEFAKDCGPFETVDALKADVKKKLEDAITARNQASLREQVVDRLVEKNQIPVPPSLLKQEEHHMMDELENFMKMTGQPIPSHDDMHHQVHDRAERKVRAALLLWEVARQQKFEIKNEDIEARLAEIAARTGKHIAKVRVDYQGERREALQNQLLEGKVLDYLISRATIKDAPVVTTETK